MRIQGTFPDLRVEIGAQEPQEMAVFLGRFLQEHVGAFRRGEHLDFFFTEKAYTDILTTPDQDGILLEQLKKNVQENAAKDRERSRVRIYIASNKFVPFPINPAYQPVIVGERGRVAPPSVVTDSRGDNISMKNPCYCELTALYWAWKNDALKDYIGLAHYRRYFQTLRKDAPQEFGQILQEDEIVPILQQYDMITLSPYCFHGYTIGEEYERDHNPEDLRAARTVIEHRCPDDLEAFDAVMHGHVAYLCNMFITRREIFCDYMAWLFGILFEVEREVGGFLQRDHYQRRAPGFLAERLLNVYIRGRQLRIKEVPQLKIEGLSLAVSGEHAAEIRQKEHRP